MDFIIREAVQEDAHAIANVHVRTWQTTYLHILPEEFLQALSVETREEMWKRYFQSSVQNSHLYVAEVDGEVIAFANFGPQRDEFDYDCELYAIYMLEAYQRKGIGRALTKAAAARMVEDGCQKMYVWVLERNPAIGFYEAIGGEKFDERPIDIDGTMVTEFAYGYNDLAKIAAS